MTGEPNTFTTLEGWKPNFFLAVTLAERSYFFSLRKRPYLLLSNSENRQLPNISGLFIVLWPIKRSKIIFLVFMLFWVSSEITKVKEFIHPAFFVCRVCLISRALTSSHMETSNLPTAWWITAGYLRLLITDSQLLGTNKRKFTHLSMRITEVNVKY